MIYNLDSILTFGQFKGYSIERIYKGSKKLSLYDKVIINDYINDSSLNFNEGSFKRMIFKDQIPLQQSLGLNIIPIDWLQYVLKGQKSYIEWCIINVENFCVEPKVLLELELLEFVIPKEFKVLYFEKIKKGHNIHTVYDVDFELLFDVKKSIFSKKLKDLNLNKFENFKSLKNDNF